MPAALDSQLNETLRDALVAYTLHEVVPNAPVFVDAELDKYLKTANDLYEYLLLDVQVSQNVQSSPVASAIASLQQYINGALLGMEPGYEDKVMEDHVIRQWRAIDSQYPIWAANEHLGNYPESYIDPSLRLHKSMYFEQLENDLNQNRINVDTAQEAIKNYLVNFEEVANLTIINGYVSTDDFANGLYYFIGKSRGESQYYWRSVDMSQRTYKDENGTNPGRPKFDYPQPGAWSDWHKAPLPISASAIERTIRPVFFNNRLFVFWVECLDNSPDMVSVQTIGELEPDAPVTTVKSNPMLRLNLVYKKYDDSWSVPQTCIEAWSDSPLFKTQPLEEWVDSIAIREISTSPESIFVAMYAGYTAGTEEDGSKDEYAFLKTALIDKNFNITPLFPNFGRVPIRDTDTGFRRPYVLKTTRTFAGANKFRFQFTMPALSISVKRVVVDPAHPETAEWNYGGWQNKLATPNANVDVTYDREKNQLGFVSRLSSAFTTPGVAPEKVHAVTRVILVDITSKREMFLLTFVVVPADGEGNLRLEQGSTIKALQSDFITGTNYRYHFYLTNAGGNSLPGGSQFLRANDSTRDCQISTLGLGQERSLVGNFVTKSSMLILSHPTTTYLRRMMIVRSASSGLYDTSLQLEVGNISYRELSFKHLITRPQNATVPAPLLYSSMEALNYGQYKTQLATSDSVSLSLDINPGTLLPDWNIPWPLNSTLIPLIHGVAVREDNGAGALLGFVFKALAVELEVGPTLNRILIAPRLGTRASPTLGVAEFIDFTGSGIETTDGSTTVKRQPIRMNTLFTRELINKANIALEHLLSWETQGLEEPPLEPASGNSQMDFHGANGKYFWEMFLHLPLMVSQRLNLEQQFDGAEEWLGFIFDPARKTDPDDSGRPKYWNVRPLVDDPLLLQMDYATRAPNDPDGIASSHPVRYRKAVYLHYLKNLQDRGDMAYRQLTPDSLGEAKLWYVRILDLLGPRPDVKQVNHWTPITLHSLSTAHSPALKAFEQQLIEQDNARVADGFSEPLLQLRTFTADPTLRSLNNAHLRLPFNSQLVQAWDTVELRLDNLRNNRTLDGKPLSPPLFAAPLDPRALLAAFGPGASTGGAARLLAQDVPPYRFTVMHARASAAVDTLIQFGHTLLSLIERKEQAALQELQQHQMWDFAHFAIELQTQAQAIEVEQRAALEASRAVVQQRFDFYAARANERESLGEKAAAGLHLVGVVADGVEAVGRVVAAGLKVAPNAAGGGGGGFGGLGGGAFACASVGGWRLEGVPQMLSAAASGLAALEHGSAQALDRAEELRNRQLDWIYARDQAALEIEQIDAQLVVFDAQCQTTKKQLEQAEHARDQALATYDFLHTRFTNAQLYQWLNGQFSTFYYQAHDATLALCLAAEACWQFEIADFSRRFIQTGGWNDSQRGLGAGEALKLQLLRMGSAYLTRHERHLEITKTVSLRRLKAMDPAPSLLNQDWDTVHARLLDDGVAAFELSAGMFEDDYPGASLRRIQRVGVTLPVALGPYEDVCATLTQTWSAVQIGDTLKENLRAVQQVALSSGEDDAGQFTSADDGRYRPFEGTGAISRWELRFTEQDLEQRHRQIESLTDIILHVRYTALAGQE